MADKSTMQCNRPTTSDRPGKKMMVKGCSNGEEKLLHFGAKGSGKKPTPAMLKQEKIISKAKKYESKSSLNGKMSFLKGNVGKVKK